MNKRTNEVDRLKHLIADLEAEVSATQAEAAPLTNRMHAVSTAIADADTVLLKPYSYPAHREAQEAKSSAYFERGQLAQQIQDNKRHVDTLKNRLSELRGRLHRAEYESVSAVELSGLLSRHVAAIQSIDSERDDLTLEHVTLQQKRLEAQQAGSTVDSAERELITARAEYDQSQGDAFISGETVDLSAHVDRIGKAEKRLQAATRNAAAGRSALPRISARLVDIDGERVDLAARRAGAVADYWKTRKQMVEIDYLEAVQRVIEAGRRLAALANKTGDRFGHDLITSMRQGLKQPVNGRSLEPVRIVDTDFGDFLAEFESELSAALSEG